MRASFYTCALESPSTYTHDDEFSVCGAKPPHNPENRIACDHALIIFWCVCVYIVIEKKKKTRFHGHALCRQWRTSGRNAAGAAIYRIHHQKRNVPAAAPRR